MVIKDIIEKCKGKSEKEIKEIVLDCLRRDNINFSKKLTIDNNLKLTQKKLFGKLNYCVATTLYASFSKNLTISEKEYIDKVNSLPNPFNIPKCIDLVNKYSNIHLKSYGYGINRFGDRETVLEIIRKSINSSKSCVIHFEDNLTDTSHHISIYGYDGNKYIYFIENAYENVTLKALSVQYAIVEIAKNKNNLKCNMELISTLPKNYETLNPVEFSKYTERYLLSHISNNRQRILTDILLDYSMVIAVIYDDSIGDYPQNFGYVSYMDSNNFSKCTKSLKELLSI